jgi:hypothetical protein
MKINRNEKGFGERSSLRGRGQRLYDFKELELNQRLKIEDIWDVEE